MANSSVSLLRFNGANNSTTFTDEIGRVWTPSSAIISTAQSKFGGASGYFNGASNVTTPSSTDFNFGTGDFTVEAWVYFSASTGATQVVMTGGVSRFAVTRNNSGYIEATQDGVAVRVTSTSTVSISAWHHIAACRASGTTTIYIDGAASGSAADSTNYTGTDTLYVGSAGLALYLNGYIDDLHIIKGFAKYTGTFTPPSAPSPRYTQFTDAKTVLCIHADGPHGSTSLTDSSGTGKTITCVGDAKISTSKWAFGKGSIVLDGVGDYVSTPDHADLQFGAEDFTIEGWFNLAAYPADYCMLFSKYTSAADRIELYLGNNTTGDSGLRFATNASGEVAGHANSTATLSSLGISLNTWYHYAVTRQSGLVRAFLGGTLLAQTYTRASALNVAGPALQIGSRSGTLNVNGNLDDFTVTKGYAKYVASFSLPTQPMPRVALALHMDPYLSGGTTFVEETGKTVTNNGVTGNADVKQFGITSGYFNGVSSYMTIPASTDWDFGAGNFTIHGWIRADDTASTAEIMSTNTGAASGWSARVSAGSLAITLTPNGIGGYVTASTPITQGAMSHFAIVRNGTELAVYINGVKGTPATLTGGFSQYFNNTFLSIGRNAANSSWYFKGLLDDLVIIKGSAMWTSDFTPPSAPMQPNCVLGLHFDGTNGSTTFNEETGKAVTNSGVVADETIKKIGQSSAKFNGSAMISTPAHADFAFGTGDFTVAGWVAITGDSALNSSPERGAIICQCTNNGTSADGAGWGFSISGNSTTTGTGLVFMSHNGASWDAPVSFSASISKTDFHFMSVSRKSGVVYIGLDGVILGSSTYAQSIGDSQQLTIGRETSSGWPNGLVGNIDDLVIIKGQALYTSSFTPPTAQFPPNKVLWMSFDEQTSKSTVRNEAGGSPTSSNILLDTSVKAVGLSSARFNGTSSSILIPASTDLQLTGDFTIKGWFNLLQVNGNNMLLGSNNGASSDYVTVTPTLIGMAFANASWPGWNASISANTWYYLFITRSSGLVRVWLNGAELTLNTGSATQAAQLFQTGVGLYMGRYGYSTPNWLNGYMDDWKIINGVAEADSSVPTKPFRDRESSKYSVYQLSEQTSLKSAQLSKTPLALYADWSSDDIASDTSGNGRHATIVGDVTHGSRLGYSGFYMGGTSSYIESPQITALNDLSAGYSVEFVIDPGVKSSYSNFVSLGRGVVGNSLSGVVNIGTADTAASVSPIHTQFYNATTGQGSLSCPQTSHAYSGLKHVVVTHAAGDRRIYVNGELVSRDAAALPATDATRDRITIGAWPAGAADKYLGFISNVAIYGRPLTSAEVLENAKFFSAELIANSAAESMSVSSTLSSILISTNVILETVSETVIATSTVDAIIAAFYTYYEAVAETMGISPSAFYPLQYIKTIVESAIITDPNNVLRKVFAVLTETLNNTDPSSAAKGMTATVSEAMAINSWILLALLAKVTESFHVSDYLTNASEILLAITESLSLGDHADAQRAVIAAVFEEASLNSNLTSSALLQEMIREGFSMTLVQQNGSESWSGFAVNTNNMASSIYEGFKFNSYAKVGEDYYGASSTGIHRIGASETDNGEFINAIVTTGLINLGTTARKGIDNAFIIMRNDGDCFLRVIADGQEYSYKMMHERDGKFEGSRVKIGKGLRAVTWQFEIYNSDGADFDIDGAVIYPLVLSRHV